MTRWQWWVLDHSGQMFAGMVLLVVLLTIGGM
jgi:hypothetical protein